jgi:hypothetical protein
MKHASPAVDGLIAASGYIVSRVLLQVLTFMGVMPLNISFGPAKNMWESILFTFPEFLIGILIILASVLSAHAAWLRWKKLLQKKTLIAEGYGITLLFVIFWFLVGLLEVLFGIAFHTNSEFAIMILSGLLWVMMFPVTDIVLTIALIFFGMRLGRRFFLRT